MKHIVIISGKGGTGKTTLAASFCALADNPVTVDCDVDAANMHLLLNPSVIKSSKFYGGKYAFINKDKCNGCGLCAQKCRFEAVDLANAKAQVNIRNCEGCGLCARICPAKAIEMKDRLSGEWFISDTQYGPFVHARLGAGEENSGKLVSKIKQEAFKIADENHTPLVIADGPPGIGCPVAASLVSADLAVVVCEPTMSAIQDMKRVLDAANFLGVKCAVTMNKWNLNRENTLAVEQFCRERQIHYLGRISFSTDANKAIENKLPLAEYENRKLAVEIKDVWTNVLLCLERHSA